MISIRLVNNYEGRKTIQFFKFLILSKFNLKTKYWDIEDLSTFKFVCCDKELFQRGNEDVPFWMSKYLDDNESEIVDTQKEFVLRILDKK